jgi:hypothetical protein
MTSREDADAFRELLNGYAEELGRPACNGASAPSSPVPQGEEAASAGRLDKAALYSQILAEEGYRFTTDEDGDLSIRIQGRWFCLFASDDDAHYFRLAIPNVFECTSEPETVQALSLVNEMNRHFKVVKLTLVDGCIWCNVEMFLAPLESFRAMFERCVDLLCMVCGDFQRRMRGKVEPPAPPASKESH